MKDESKTKKQLIDELIEARLQIDELKKTGVKQELAEEKLVLFKNTVESSADAIGMSTPEGKHWYQNKAFDDLFGDIGSSPPDSVYVDINTGNEIFKTIIAGGRWTGEVEMYGKDKNILNIFLRAYAIKDHENNVLGLTGIHTNITKRKIAEKALQESNERFRLLANNLLSVMIYQVVMKPDGSRQFTYVSENIKSINKISAEAVLADPNVLYSQVLPAHLPELIRKEEIALKNMTAFRYETQLRLPDGEIKWFQLVSTPHKLPNGNVIWDGVQIDINDRKKAVEALKKQQQVTENIIEGTNAGTWDWNIQTGEIIFNERWAEIMGHTLKELMPVDISTWQKSVHPDDYAAVEALMQLHFKGELEYYDIDFRQLHKNGGWVWVNACGKVVEWDNEGKPLRMSGTHLDITARKKIETQRIHLDKINRVIIGSDEVEQMLRNVLNAVLEIFLLICELIQYHLFPEAVNQ